MRPVANGGPQSVVFGSLQQQVTTMGVRIIGDDDYAAIYDSVTMTAFGPVFNDADEAERFLQWLPSDARGYGDSELHDKVSDFRDMEEQKAAREKKRDAFLRQHNISGPVWDMLTSAFEEEEREGSHLENFDDIADDHKPEQVAEAWELYQRYHAEVA